MSKIMDYIQRYYYNFIVIAVMMTDIRIYSKICLFAGIILEFTALDQRFQFDEIWLSERQNQIRENWIFESSSERVVQFFFRNPEFSEF